MYMYMYMYIFLAAVINMPQILSSSIGLSPFTI